MGEERFEREKIAVVTGGVRGIGFAVACALKEKGYRVYALYSKDEKSAAAAQVLRLRSRRSARGLFP